MDYKSAGVNIEEGNNAVELIKPIVKTTHSSQVLSNIGGFAAGFEFPVHKYKKPILVSATDGVGTKLVLAIESGNVSTIGIDCVAMCVNDLICMGADPLFFLDYIACHKINPIEMKSIISGIADGCKQANCSLIGGEMAEMNSMYKQGDFDVAGFCVGVVEKDAVINGQSIDVGDYIYALPSSGCHSNGYSLIRKIVNETSINKEHVMDLLLEPTRIYVNDIKELTQQYHIKGIANITGGGLIENITRVLPNHVDVDIDKANIQVPTIFSLLQQYGEVSTEEMYRVFNMGVGMVVITNEKISDSRCYCIGKVSGKK